MKKILDIMQLQERFEKYTLDAFKAEYPEYFAFDEDDQRLLDRYFAVPNYEVIAREYIEMDVNITMLGYRREEKPVPLDQLYPVYLSEIDEYSEEERLFIECFIFGKGSEKQFWEKYKESTLSRYYLLNQLEKKYYGIERLCVIDEYFTKAEYLEVLKMYRSAINDEYIEILNLYYGIDGPPLDAGEIAQKLHKDNVKIGSKLANAKSLIKSLYYKTNIKKIIDRDIYEPLIRDKTYVLPSYTREILHMHVIDGKSYEEISRAKKITKSRVSAIIMLGLKKLDEYRLGMATPSTITREVLSEYFGSVDYFDEKEQEIIILKYIEGLENPAIAKTVGKKNAEVNRVIARFNKLFFNYKIKDVTLTEEDIKEEIFSHPAESLLTDQDKEFISLYFGIKCAFNEEGIILTKARLQEKYGITLNTLYHRLYNIINNLKGKKIGLDKAFGATKQRIAFFKRSQLEKIMKDERLPISEEDRKLICALNGVGGYPYIELGDYEGGIDNIYRKYINAILKVKKYLAGELEGKTNYELDVVPFLRYFKKSHRILLTDYFKNGLSYEELAKKHGTTFDKIAYIMRKLKREIKAMGDNPDAKRFDFGFYEEAKDDPQIPFYGSLEAAKRFFEAYMNQESLNGRTIEEIIEEEKLDVNERQFLIVVSNFMLSICKLQDGLIKEKGFTHEQIKAYYDAFKDSMSERRRKTYSTYFERKEGINGKSAIINKEILYDLIKWTYNYIFLVDYSSKEEVIAILRRYNQQLNNGTKRSLVSLFGIRESVLMTASELRRVFLLLSSLPPNRNGASYLVRRNSTKAI